MPSKSALRLPLIRLALAGTSALALVATAQAQEAEQETVSNGDSTALEALVVNGSGGVIAAEGYVGTSSATGAKIDTPFLETPQSISTVTEQQLKDRNPQTLLETLAYTPGTRVGAYGFDPRFDAFFVRGFDVTYSGVFRDNLRQPAAVDSIFKNEPYGLEGVSILRGPLLCPLRRNRSGRPLQPHHQAADGGHAQRGAGSIWQPRPISGPVRLFRSSE
ncbi:TonB-dependent receptor plug domain-containing protein [Sinorhizobium meliloti]|nr:TonB-dependent receptor plug domain-containing protein [Sinorhizobium meliloti]